ncbi:hypothetical protein PR048_023621 [Dryococelus australis]|uniref:Uncharacterized protein n=1 Tax=Dryococelus australis TaxID=614101 RepID=A0ABQ9GUM9_9NEOP|nr:hypothetical protein PR048_023621 [Dryococelus australis]
MWKGCETDLTSMNPKRKKLSGCEEYEKEKKVQRRRLQCDEINRDSDMIFDSRIEIKSAKKAVETYPDDVDIELIEEYVNFLVFPKEIKQAEESPGNLLKTTRSKGLIAIYPNTDTFL